MVRENPKTGGKVYTVIHARSKTHTIANNFDDEYEKMREKMLENLAKYQKEGSGWRILAILKLAIFVTKFKPLTGKKYTTPLAKELQGKKGDYKHSKQRRSMLQTGNYTSVKSSGGPCT